MSILRPARPVEARTPGCRACRRGKACCAGAKSIRISGPTIPAEMCVIPYGTQEGEISFCAYNTGVGWRQVVENMHTVAKTKDWFEARGRHQIYAGNRPVALAPGRKLPIVGATPIAPVGGHLTNVG